MSEIDDIFEEIEELANLRGICLVFISTNEQNPEDDEEWIYRIDHKTPDHLREMFPGEYTSDQIEDLTKKHGMMDPLLIQVKIFGGAGKPLSGMIDEEDDS